MPKREVDPLINSRVRLAVFVVFALVAVMALIVAVFVLPDLP